MRVSRFQAEVLVRIEGRLLTLAHECSIDDSPHWAMRDESNILEHKSTAELKYLYEITKTLVFVQAEDPSEQRKKRREHR